MARKKQKRSSCLSGIGCLVVIVACIFGLFAFVGEMQEQAENEIADADGLWSSGEKARAVEVYKTNYGLAPSGRKDELLKRILEHSVATGDRESAKQWARRAANEDRSIDSEDEQVRSLLGEAEREVAEEERKLAEERRKREIESKRNDVVSIGDVGYLRVPSGGPVAIASTEAARKRLMEFSLAKDTEGIDQMILSGSVYIVPSGTRARLIKRPSLFAGEVRILEGDYEGQLGYIETEFLKGA